MKTTCKWWLGSLLAVALVVWSGCLPAGSPDARVKAYVSIPPLAYFVERVGGRYVEVSVLVKPGQSPHIFEPTPRQMAGLSRANVYFSVGFPFEERLLTKITAMNGHLKVVDTCRGVVSRTLSAEEIESHEAGEHGHEEHGHAGHGHAAGEPDPHVWLSPRLARIQAANICNGLAVIDRVHAADYERNLKAFQADLDRVDARLTRALAPLRGRAFLVYHPAFGYFADAYGLRQVPVEVGGKEPSARQLASLIDRARRDGIRVIFVQPRFPRRSAEWVARAIGGAVVPMDDLPRNYLKNLEDMAAKLQAAPRGK
ncbi:MAG: zinc ABC transporter substrate-binding protein [Pseudomonadota bacterium]